MGYKLEALYFANKIMTLCANMVSRMPYKYFKVFELNKYFVGIICLLAIRFSHSEMEIKHDVFS